MATENNADNFSAAFDQLAALGDKQVPVEFTNIAADAAAAKAETEATKAAADKAVADAEAAKAVATDTETEIEELTDDDKGEGEGGEEKAAQEEPKTTVTDRDADLLAKFAKAIKEEPKQQVQQEPQNQQVQQAPLFNEDEVKFLTDFEKEWPDVARANQVMLRAATQQVTNHIFAEIAKTLGPRLAMLEGLADRAHVTDLHTSVPDYDDVRDKVIDWASKQPAYLRTAYDRVISEGTVDEVADLIGRYRTDTGSVTRQPAPVVTAKKDTELSTSAKKAAAALAPVGSKRSAVVQQTGPDDFDGAFAEFAKEVL